MATNALNFTQAVRQLSDETDGAITHAEARPRLQAMGFELAEHPERKSQQLADFLKVLATYQKPKNDAEFNGVVKKATVGWSQSQIDAMLREYYIDKAFRAERNSFDVAKSMWGKNRQLGISTKKSTKPVSNKPTTPSKPAAPVAPVNIAATRGRGRPRTKGIVEAVDTSKYDLAFSALKYVQSNGGASKLKTQIDALKAEAHELSALIQEKLSQAAELEEKLSLVAEFKNYVNHAA